MTATAALDFFARSVRERLFVPRPKEMQRVGAEIEMLPFFADSGLPCPLEAKRADERCTLALIRAHGARCGMAWSGDRRRARRTLPCLTAGR